MFTHLRLDSFKNHKTASYEWKDKNLIFWPNGSGKTNVLESLYLLCNGTPIPGRTMTQSVHFSSGAFSVSWGILKNDLEYDCRLGCDLESKSVRFIFQWQDIKRTRYLDAMPARAIFFSPMEMNILYLGPSLRRDILDEAVLLSYPDFLKTKRDYATALKNRNAVLKSIREKNASMRDLAGWDEIFSEQAKKYYEYRLMFVNYISDNIAAIESLLEWKYSLSFDYITKTDLSSIKESVLEYLASHRERDIITGHTCIGPHLDDFSFGVMREESRIKSDEYLSRGENKTILIGLKFLSISFLEEKGWKESILLLDDLFSELDEKHIALLLERAWVRQIFITSQWIPEFLRSESGFNIIEIN